MEGKVFGLTVTHILDKDQEEPPSLGADAELSIDEEEDEDSMDITSQDHPHVRSLVRQVSKRANILALTATQGSITGFISSNATYMQLSNSSAYQEVWTVRLDAPLERGDSGTWIIKPDTGALYGYITAGIPGTSTAYIIPAYLAFLDIEQRMGHKITFLGPEGPLEAVAAQLEVGFLQNRTTLSWAAAKGHEAIVKLLLDTGKVDVDSRDSGNRTTLSWAVQNGLAAVVELLPAVQD